MQNRANFLRPSNITRRIICPASATMEVEYGIKSTNNHAKRGTMLHEYMEQLTYNNIDINDIKLCQEDMKALTFSKKCHDSILDVDANIYRAYEKEYSLNFINDGMVAHPDCVIINITSSNIATINIIDYKFGMMPVFAYNNHQLILYYLSVIRDKGVSKTLNDNEIVDHEVKLHIIQPKLQSHDIAHYDKIERVKLCTNFYDLYLTTAEKCNSSKLLFKYDFENCKYCEANYKCKHFVNKIL